MSKDYSDAQEAVAAITEMEKMLAQAKAEIIELAEQRINMVRQDSLSAMDYSRDQIKVVTNVKTDPTSSLAMRGIGHDRFIRGLLPEINKAFKSISVVYKRTNAKAEREGLLDE